MPPIWKTSSERLKLTIQTYQWETKNLKWSLDSFKGKFQKHLCQLVLIQVMTLNELFCKLTKEKLHPSWDYFGRSNKNIHNLLKIMLHITPWTLILMLHIRQSIYLVLKNVLSTSFWWNQLNTVNAILWKGRYTRYIICSCFGIIFLLFSIKIENAV